MSYRIGSLDQRTEDFLAKEGVCSPYDVRLDWDHIPEGFFPVVVIKNFVSSFADIAVNRKDLNELASLDDDRPRRIFLLRIENLLKVGGQAFIDYVKENKLVSEDVIQIAEQEEKERLVKTLKLVFGGQPEPFGGLSNEEILARACPEEFKLSNPWSNYAMKIFFCGGKISNWKFNTESRKEMNRQFGCFQGLLGSFGIKHENKEAVAGWMLSLMLQEVPEYIPAGKD